MNKYNNVEDKLKVLIETITVKEQRMNKQKAKDNVVVRTGKTRLFEMIEESDSLNTVVDHKRKYHCSNCDIAISTMTYEATGDHLCPKCGDEFEIMEDTSILDTSRRFICGKCSANYKYSKITEDVCIFCNSMMTVCDKLIVTQSKTAIPTD